MLEYIALEKQRKKEYRNNNDIKYCRGSCLMAAMYLMSFFCVTGNNGKCFSTQKYLPN